MKRAAEKQLNKNDAEQDVDMEGGGASDGFMKADDSALAARPMRALPRRAKTSNASLVPPPNGSTETSSAAPPPASRFAGFAGFGSAASGTTPFSFSSPSSTIAPPPAPSSTASTSVFGKTEWASSAPTVAASASPATKLFASFTSPTAAPAVLPSPPVPAPSHSVAKEASEKPDESATAVTYYCSLRGLNASIFKAIKTAIDKDPFVDMSEIFRAYQSKREDIQREFDRHKAKIKPTDQASPNVRGSQSSTISNSASAASKPPPTMPAPPSGFAGFGSIFGPKPSDLNPATSEKPSSLPASTPAPAATTPSASFVFGKTSSFPNPFASTESSKLASTSSSPFTFGSSSTSTSSNPFLPSDSSKPSADKPSSAETALSSEKPKNLTNPFGATSSPFGSGAPVFGSGKTSEISFGKAPSTSPTTLGASPFGAFGKSPASGSIGNPVGFGFGALQKQSETAPAALAEDEKSAGSGVEEDDPAKYSLSNTHHDKEGAGEEDEGTLHEVRSKVFKLVKNDGASKWADMGIGMCRVKKHKANGSRRMLLRNSNTGKVILNFRLYPGISPTLSKNFVSFVGHETDGTPANYKLKVKSEQEAKDLRDIMEKESKDD